MSVPGVVSSTVDILLRLPTLYLFELGLVSECLWDVPYDSLLKVVEFLQLIILCVCSLVFFSLDQRALLRLYCGLIISSSLVWALRINVGLFEIAAHQRSPLDLDSDDVYNNIVSLLAAVFSFTLCYSALNGRLIESESPWYSRYIKVLLLICSECVFIVPVSLLLLFFDLKLFTLSLYLSMFVGSISIFVTFASICGPYLSASSLRQKYTTTRQIGIWTSLESIWIQRRATSVLRTYSVVRLVVLFYAASRQSAETMVYFHYPKEIPKGLFGIAHESTIDMGRFLLGSSCDNPLAVIAFGCWVSVLGNLVGDLVTYRLLGPLADEDHMMGNICGVLFCILALQSGLTGLDEVVRLERLYRNAILLLSSGLHTIHSMVAPVLERLSTQVGTSRGYHVRALALCLFIATSSMTILVYLWLSHSMSTWLLACTVFSVEVIIKVVVSLMLYMLFMFDTKSGGAYESMDDYIYYIRATGSIVEFIFGIILFLNGGYVLFFEAGGVIRAVMMCLHAYLNIFEQARNGWRTFNSRRTAVRKVESLDLADDERLGSHDDLCAICYQPMSEQVRVTRCNHLFHALCLRKWLYIQDSCPMCHQNIFAPQERGLPSG